MAANADVSKGHLNPLTDLKFNTIMTSNVLEYIRQKNKRNCILLYGSVYGETKLSLLLK